MLRPADVTIFNAFMIADRIPAATARTGRLLEIVYEFPVWRCGTPDLREHLVRSLRRNDVGHIATSAVVEQMLSEFGVRPIAKVTCGIDLPSPSLIPPNPGRRHIIGFPLRPEAHKGALDMLRAIPLIRAEHPEVLFECFGRYDEHVDFPEGLEFHGYLDEQQLLALYRRCALFVLPSHAEGWGLPAAEAMANGAAVVVTDNGGSSDFAIDRETALVVPPGDPGAIAAAVSSLLVDSSLRSKIVIAGMKRCQQMSWEIPVAQLVSLFPTRTGEDSTSRSERRSWFKSSVANPTQPA